MNLQPNVSGLRQVGRKNLLYRVKACGQKKNLLYRVKTCY
jgi:hypothetical protein